MGRRFPWLAFGALVFGPALLQAQQPATTTSTAQPLALSLDEALRRATGTSEAVAIARSGEQRARGQLGQAKSALMPQLGTTVNWQKQLQNQFASIAKSAGAVDTGAGETPSFTRLVRYEESIYSAGVRFRF